MDDNDEIEEGHNKRKRLKSDDEDSLNLDEVSAPVSSSSPPLLYGVPPLDYSSASSGQVPPLISTENASLEDIIFPLSPQDFAKDCFRKSALHITCQSGQEEPHCNRFQDIVESMLQLDVESILQETSSDSIFVWLQNQNTNQEQNTPTTRTIKSIEVADVETALALYEMGGHSVYCRAPPQVEQHLVAALLKGTGMGCGQYDPTGESFETLGRGEVEVFITGSASHLTDWHFDFQENFTLQLSGQRRWTLQKSTVKHPLRGCTPHYAAPEAVESQIKAARLSDPAFQFGVPQPGVNATDDKETILMKPGDVLYFPAGMWHQVETVEPGVSINVSLMATNYATVVCQALQHLLLKRDEWRQCVVQNQVTSATEQLRQLLQELPGIILRDLESGANAILPPVLCFPPKFEPDQESETAQEDGNGDEEQEETGGETEGETEGGGAEDEEMIEQENEQDGDDDDDDEQVFDVMEFDDYPNDWAWERPHSHKLTRNPLACLFPLDQATTFYNPNGAQKDVFVLNVNYAGSESHESAVRVLLREESGALAELCDQEGLQEPPAADLDVRCPELVRCLLFHGYLRWIPVSD